LPARTSSSKPGTLLPAKWFGGGASLGPWICLPLLAFFLVAAAAMQVPGSDCLGSGSGSDSDEGEAVAIVVGLAGLSSLVALAAAVQRLWALRRAGAFSARRDWTIAGIVALVLIAIAGRSAARPNVHLSERVEGLLIAGPVLAILALVALLLAWAARRRLDDVGLLMPLYLIGAALFAYPFVMFLALVSNSGAFC
jgi:hypothetical protein